MVVATVRVTSGMRDWMKANGAAAVRAAIQAAMDGVIREPVLVAQNAEVSAEPVIAPKPAPVVEKPRNTDKRIRKQKPGKSEAEPVPRKSAIPMDLAAQVARIAAEKEARKKAREGLSDVGRLLSQFGK